MDTALTHPPVSDLVFLKLGGSLITDKQQPRTPRLDVLQQAAAEIAAARAARPGLQLVLGHGSGSFGHVPAQRYGTRQGVATPEQWRGFVEVWQDAAALNHIVLDALHAAGLPAIPFSPLAGVIAEAGRAAAWDLSPLRCALQAGLLPVVYGDVIFDRARGGTILSTEDLFEYLAPRLRPQTVLLAGLDAGVFADFPACTRLVARITTESYPDLAASLGGSAAVDVTGGMQAKVQAGLRLAQSVAGLEVRIFSGAQPGAVQAALSGRPVGTLITAAASTF